MASLRTNKTVQQQQSSPTSPGASPSKNHAIPPTTSNNSKRHNGSSRNGISLRRVSWLLIGTTAVAFGGGILLLQGSWSMNNTSSSGHTGADELTASARNLRHDNQSLRQRQSQQDSTMSKHILHFLDNDKIPQQHQQQKIVAPSSSIMPIQILQETWEYPLVHIVNTRFMQEQGHLQALGMARYLLFQTFCLPSMLHQSTQQFLWIIKTDPHLHPPLLEQLIALLQPHPNIYLVASNVNYMIRDTHSPPGGHSWRDGAEIRDILGSEVYTGNVTQLYQAMVQKDSQVVLETRLDADDGLHKYYLQRVQDKALERFYPAEETEESDQQQQHHDSPKTIPKWLYWCTRRHIEWHGGVKERHVTPKLLSGNNDNADTTLATIATAVDVDYHGSLLPIQHSRLCITPGITVGFGIGTTSDQVPIHAHDKLFQAIHDLPREEACGYHKAKDCLELVEDFLLVAIRARTPTSAGMQRVEDEEDDGEDDNDNETASSEKLSSSGNHTVHRKHNKKKPKGPPKAPPLRMFQFWDLLHDDFSVLRPQIKYTNQYILNHLVPIAKDNLEGQCTSDHSCKEDTKEKLMKIIEEHK